MYVCMYVCMYKYDLTLNNPQGLLYRRTQVTNQSNAYKSLNLRCPHCGIFLIDFYQNKMNRVDPIKLVTHYVHRFNLCILHLTKPGDQSTRYNYFTCIHSVHNIFHSKTRGMIFLHRAFNLITPIDL